MKRRSLLKAAPAIGLLSAAPWAARAQYATSQGWRTFEVITRLEITPPTGQVLAWVPLPLTQKTDWFETLSNTTGGNAERAQLYTDPVYDAGMVVARFKAGEPQPVIEVTSRFRTRDRFVPLRRGCRNAGHVTGAGDLPQSHRPDAHRRHRRAKRPSRSRRAKSTDVDKTQAVYDWIVDNTYREPKVRGCGVGDIKAMLETGNLGGKCADLNALFVGLVPLGRRAGARRLRHPRRAVAASATRRSARAPRNISKAQHCRAEVFLKDYGWVAMDPADVRKVVREETTELDQDTTHPVVARCGPSSSAAGRATGWPTTTAHDVALPGRPGRRSGLPDVSAGRDRAGPAGTASIRTPSSTRSLRGK